MNPTPPTYRVHGLDTLRALAIIMVFMYHYTAFVSGADTFGIFSEVGWAGVDLFFALSGYLIGNQIFAALRSERGFSLKNFYARRLLRTLPNFYVILALFYLWPGFRGTSELLPVWKFFTFTQNYHLMPGTAFSHAWSLCIEEQFYMLLPAAALLVAGLRRSIVWAWCAVAAMLVGGMLLRGSIWRDLVDGNAHAGVNFYRYIYYSSFCRFDELVAGGALALLKNYHAPAWKRLTASGNAMFAGGIALTALTFYLLLHFYQGYAMTVFGYPMLALAFSMLIVAALSPGSLLRDTRIPGAGKIALWSYALYLTHKQACVLASVPLQKAGFGPDTWPAVAVLAALSVFSGWVLYTFVETPFMELRKRYVPSNYSDGGAISAPLR